MIQQKQYFPIAPITDFVLLEHTNNLYKQVAKMIDEQINNL